MTLTFRKKNLYMYVCSNAFRSPCKAVHVCYTCNNKVTSIINNASSPKSPFPPRCHRLVSRNYRVSRKKKGTKNISMDMRNFFVKADLKRYAAQL